METPKPNVALLAKIAEFRATGDVPPIRMGIDPTVPDADVFWAHRDTRAVGTDFVDIALMKENQNYDPRTKDGLANFRAFHLAMCLTIARMGGFKIPPAKEGYPASPAYIESISKDPETGAETTTQIAEMSPLTSALSGLSTDQQLAYERARAILLNTLIQYQKRFALLSGDRHWDDPPVRSKRYNPIFTQDSDPEPTKEFKLQTPPPTPNPNAKPDEVPPVLIGADPGTVAVALVVGIVALAVVVCVLEDKVSDAYRVGKGVDALQRADDAAHNGMTESGQQALALLKEHEKRDLANKTVTPLTPAEEAQLEFLRDQQRLYYEKSKSLESQIFGLTKPSPPASQTFAEQIGDALKTAAWIAGGVFAVKIVFDALTTRKIGPPTAPPRKPEEEGHEEERSPPYHGHGAMK